MDKIFAGWLVMIVTTVVVFLAVCFVGGMLDSGGGTAMGVGSAAFLLVMVFGSSFTGYWVSIRLVVQSRTTAPDSLSNSTNSECES